MLMAPANFKTQIKDSDSSQSCIPSAGLMLQAVLESLDGILILTPSGKWLDANSTAEHTCRR